MKLSSIVYLDTSFVTDAYEAFSGKPVPTKIVKSENISGGFSAGIFSAGAASQETKEFPITAHAMFEEMRADLDSFPTVDLGTTDAKDLPEYFWADATFAIGSSQVTRKDEILHQDVFFRLLVPGAEKKGVYMLTSDTYFSAGYDQVLRVTV